MTDGPVMKSDELKTFDEFIIKSLENTPNSSSFIDSDRTIGRKGMLTLIDQKTGDNNFVYTISNSRVLCFYQSKSFLSIIRLYRNSNFSIKDINSSPCFIIISNTNEDENSMICASSSLEKDSWTLTIKNNIGSN